MNENFLKETTSICPECHKVLQARLVEKNRQVMMVKSCSEHGTYEDVYWSDVDEWERVRRYSTIGDGLENPRTEVEKGCPYDCGICPDHKSQTILSIIDVTNNCNLKCPICFANATAAGYQYQPTLDQIKAMIDNLAANKPVSVKALQLSGGEPTLRDDLPEILRHAHAAGIHHLEINTNGIRIANDPVFLQRVLDADVSSFYLQFDGVTPEPYKTTRGLDLLPVKMKALDNLRTAGHDSVILVVTLVKGINDNQVGQIIDFAAKNHDLIRCVNVQPVSITGRIDRNKLADYRITIPDFTKLVEEQTGGQIKRSDFFPVPSVVPFARAVGALKGTRFPEFTMHEHCGMATFVFVEDGKITPITRYANVDGFMNSMTRVAELANTGHKVKANVEMIRSLSNLKLKVLGPLIGGVMKEGTYEALGRLMRKIIMIGAMHFMDPYNFDLERVQRCGIHYAVPDGRIIPFCTMNSLHREKIERQFAKSIEPIRV
ncbi:MAG TPA: radical SAM protein [Candidatus Acidoferrales bacterium]|nr:radical SAM protein [Candidatus Acidoferrales bacterium]